MQKDASQTRIHITGRSNYLIIDRDTGYDDDHKTLEARADSFSIKSEFHFAFRFARTVSIFESLRDTCLYHR